MAPRDGVSEVDSGYSLRSKTLISEVETPHVRKPPPSSSRKTRSHAKKEGTKILDQMKSHLIRQRRRSRSRSEGQLNPQIGPGKEDRLTSTALRPSQESHAIGKREKQVVGITAAILRRAEINDIQVDDDIGDKSKSKEHQTLIENFIGKVKGDAANKMYD